MTIPGNTSVYSLSRNAIIRSAEEIDWEQTYVSSVLRSFVPHCDQSVRVIPELDTREQLEYFINCCVQLIKRNVKLFKSNDIIKTSPNTLAGKVIWYLLKKARFYDCKKFIGARKIY